MWLHATHIVNIAYVVYAAYLYNLTATQCKLIT